MKKKRQIPSLNALKAFETAARHLSFKLAAQELSVSQSAISHQIKALEESLGFPLFARKTRSVELTRKGRLYYPILRNAFDSIDEGTQMILEEKSVSVLTVQVYSTFTIRWLLPRLARFQAQHEDVQIRLHTSQADVNFDQEDVDAAIMIGQPTNASLHYDHLFDCELFPLCSPGYLEKYGQIGAPGELAGHTLLQVYPSAQDWTVWLEAQGVNSVNPDSGLQLESYDVALNSAIQGMGIALGQQPYITHELDSASLVELFPGQRVINSNRWYLAYRREKRGQHKITAFRDWLRAEVVADQSLAVTGFLKGSGVKNG